MANRANPSHNHSVRAFLDRLERERFYGTVAVRYENGTAVHVRCEESILPANIMEKLYDESNSPRQQ